MTKRLIISIAVLTIVAPTLHLASDIAELLSSGYSNVQLITNYAAFLSMPFVMIGLAAIQWPRIGMIGLALAVIYAMVFIYFAHTTLFALQESIPDYATLWSRLGPAYTIHGGLMIVSGLGFAVASIRTGILSTVGLCLFGAGLILNFAFAVLPIPELFQILGSTVRNLGLIVVSIRVFTSLRSSDQ